MASNLTDSPLPDALPSLPQGWHYEPLGSLVEERGISYGVVQPGSQTGEGIPIVRVNNIRHGRIDTNEVLRVETAIEDKFRRSRLQGGEVLLTLVGTLGEVAVVPESLRGWNVARAVGVIPVKKEPGGSWVAICLRSSFLQHCIRMWATTTVQATFNLRDVAKLPVPIPPPKTRQAIASVLGTLDYKIELNRRMNATLEAAARALFQTWFVDFDPVRAKLDGRQPAGMDAEAASLFPAEFEESRLGHIPREWRASTIGECCERIHSGGTPSRSEPTYWENPTVPWLTSGEVRQSIVIATENFISEAGFENSAAKWVDAFSTVVALYGATAGQVSLVAMSTTTNQAICSLVPKQGFEWFNYFTMREATTEMESKAVGSAQQNISKGVIEETTAVLPSPPVLGAFNRLTAPLMQKWISNLTESRTLAGIRDVLLPRLLSGELQL